MKSLGPGLFFKGKYLLLLIQSITVNITDILFFSCLFFFSFYRKVLFPFFLNLFRFYLEERQRRELWMCDTGLTPVTIHWLGGLQEVT